MRKLPFFLVLTSLLCFAGWLRVATPYSPSQDLPLISITAFEIHAPNVVAGQALAQAARSWTGVTAATYNANSGLLVLSHTLDQSASSLKSRIDILNPHPVSIKVFPEPAGAKCPVPASALAVLPGILLGCSAVSLLIAIMLFISHAKRWIMAPLQP